MARVAFKVGLSLLMVSAMAFCSTMAAPAATVDTIAGGGPDGIPALHANLLWPGAVTFDSQGVLHLTAQHRVYKVDAGGVIHAVAGFGGNRGFGGEGLPALNGNLYYPRGILFDGAGNLLIADTYNGRVRRVDALTGIITTIAGGGSSFPGDGGLATDARLRTPVGLALDSGGNLYIAEMGGNRVMRVDAATSVISTVAGGGASNPGNGGPGPSASLLTPTYLAIDDSAGILYISETQGNRVRTLDLGTGTIDTLFSGGSPSGLALDAAAGNLYITSLSGEVLRRTLSTGVMTNVATGFGFGVDWSDGGLALDGAGHLFVGDSLHNQVRRITLSSGADTPVAGNGSDWTGEDGFLAKQTFFSFPFSAVTDSAGNLYVAEDRVRRVDGVTGLVSTLMGIPAGGGPAVPVTTGYLSTDSDDNLYIVTFGFQVLRRDAFTGVLSVVAGNGTYGFNGDGGPAVDAELSYVLEAEVDGAGNVYLADTDNLRVRRVDAATGIITTVAGNGLSADSGDGGPAVAAGLNPIDLVVDAQGNLLISSNCRLRRVDAATGIITTVVGNGVCQSTGNGGPAAGATVHHPVMGSDAAGNLYLSDSPYLQLRRIDASTGIITLVAGSGIGGFWGDGGPALQARFDRVGDPSCDPAGNVIFAEGFNFRVRQVTFAADSPPVAQAGADVQAECSSASGGQATLDGSASTDPDSTPGTNDDIASFEWFENYGGADQALLGTGETASVTLPLGSHLITLRVTDAAGLSDTDEVVVAVADNIAPTMTVSMNPPVLYPPHHQLVPVHATINAPDACGAVSAILVGVTSSESTLPGGEVPPGDIRDAAYGTEDYDFELRAERRGTDSGRIYTVTYRIADAGGYQVTATGTVTVSHDRRGSHRSGETPRNAARRTPPRASR